MFQDAARRLRSQIRINGFSRHLDSEEAAGHNLIYGELLIGDSGGCSKLLESYRLMHQIADVPHEEVVVFVRANNFHGRGVGWIDAHLLASCLVAAVPLWTADYRLDKLAGELGINYRPSYPSA